MPALNKISVDNVVYDIGSNCLIVTVDLSQNRASHSATEIWNALSANKPTYLKMESDNDYGGVSFLMPIFAAQGGSQSGETDMAISTYIYGYADSEDDYEAVSVVTFTIKNDKSVEVVDISPVTVTQLGRELEDYLSKTNTIVYNPSSDYNPATKKYVDDHDYNITSGTTDPSGGSDGDIYLKYEA
jgi:hypothetical protein